MLGVNTFALLILCLPSALYAAPPLTIDAAAAPNEETDASLAVADAMPVLDQAEPIASLVERLSLNVYAADAANSADRQRDVELSLRAAAELAEEAKLVKRELSVIGGAEAPPADEDFDMEVAEIHVFRPAFRYSVEYAKKVKNQRQRQQQQLQQFG